MEYRHVEEALIWLHAIPEKGHKAFRSRLRVLRDFGVPEVERPGKGSRVDYSFADVFEMHLGLHLEHFGYPPGRVKFVVSQLRGTILDTFKEHSKKMSDEGKTGDLWMLLSFSRQKAVGTLDTEGRILTYVDCIEAVAESLKDTEKLNSTDRVRSDRQFDETGQRGHACLRSRVTLKRRTK